MAPNIPIMRSLAFPERDLQRRGIVPQNEGVVLSALQSHLVSFEPRTEGQKELFAEAHREFSRLAELRGRRLQSVREG